MKRFLKLAYAVVLLVGLPSLVYAGWNIQQKDTGATLWNNGSVTVPVGDSGLTVQLADVSTAASAFVVSHKAGSITKWYSVISDALSQSTDPADFATLSLYINGEKVTPNGEITVSASGSAAGDSDSSSPAGLNTVAQGDVIAVDSDGASDTTSIGTLTIVIE